MVDLMRFVVLDDVRVRTILPTFAQLAAAPPPLRALRGSPSSRQAVCYTAVRGDGVTVFARWHADPGHAPELRAMWEERDENSSYLRDLPKPPMGSNVLL